MRLSKLFLLFLIVASCKKNDEQIKVGHGGGYLSAVVDTEKLVAFAELDGFRW